MRLILLLICFVLSCVPLDELILRPSFDVAYTPQDFGYEYEEIILSIDENRYLSTWHIPCPLPKGIIVILPGSSLNKASYSGLAKIFIPNGYSVLLVDYEGFGESPSPTDKVDFDFLVTDGFVAIDWALANYDNVIGYGISLGTTILTRVAAERDLSACVFESIVVFPTATTDFLDLINLNFPLFVFVGDSLLIPNIPTDLFTNLWIQEVHEPKLFVHSYEDYVTPLAGVKRIFDLAPEPKQLWILDGNEHAMEFFNYPVLYTTVVNAWIDDAIFGTAKIQGIGPESLEGINLHP